MTSLTTTHLKSVILATLVAAGTAVTIAPGVAHADPPPSGCHSGVDEDGYGIWARCKTGSGYVRSIAVCRNKSGSKTTTKGVWVPVGSWSWTWCTRKHPDLVDHAYRIKTY